MGKTQKSTQNIEKHGKTAQNVPQTKNNKRQSVPSQQMRVISLRWWCRFCSVSSDSFNFSPLASPRNTHTTHGSTRDRKHRLGSAPVFAVVFAVLCVARGSAKRRSGVEPCPHSHPRFGLLFVLVFVAVLRFVLVPGFAVCLQSNTKSIHNTISEVVYEKTSKQKVTSKRRLRSWSSASVAFTRQRHFARSGLRRRKNHQTKISVQTMLEILELKTTKRVAENAQVCRSAPISVSSLFLVSFETINKPKSAN